MSDTSAVAQADMPPETTDLVKQFEDLRKERDTLISERNGAKDRAQKRWTELQHAQADARRGWVANAELQSREMSIERLNATLQATIAELKEKLDKAPSLETMDEAKEQVRKELQEQMQKNLDAAIQKLQTEHNEKVLAAHKAAAQLVQKEREADVEKVANAQQTAQKAKEETALVINEVRKLREEKTQKDQEIAFLKNKIQEQSDYIEALKNLRMGRYTPEQRKSPVKTSARARNVEDLFNGSPHSRVSPGAKSNTFNINANNGNGSFMPQGGRLGSPFMLPMTESPRQNPSEFRPSTINAARLSHYTEHSTPNMAMSGVANHPAEGMPTGFEEVMTLNPNPFADLSDQSLAQEQMSRQPEMQMQNGTQGTKPQNENLMQPPLLPSQRETSQNIHGNSRPRAPSGTSSRVEQSPQEQQQSAMAMFSYDVRNPTEQSGPQNFIPQSPTARAPSIAPQNNQQFTTGPNGFGGLYHGSTNQFEGAVSGPGPSPHPWMVQPRTASNTSVAGLSTPYQNNGSMAAVFDGQTDVMLNAMLQNGFHAASRSPGMFHPSLDLTSNVLPSNVFTSTYASPSQQHASIYEINGQPSDGRIPAQFNGVGAQIGDLSRPQIGLNHTTNGHPQLTSATNNQLVGAQALSVYNQRHPNRDPNTAQQAALLNMARAPQPSQSQQQMQRNAAQNGHTQTSNSDLDLRFLKQPFKPTPEQQSVMDNFLQQKIQPELRGNFQKFLLCMQPGNGNGHTIQQYQCAARQVIRIQKQKQAELQQSMQQRAQGGGQAPILQQNKNPQQMADSGLVFQAKMIPNVPKAPSIPQLQPHGLQEHPTSRPTQSSTNTNALPQQPDPAAISNPVAKPTSTSNGPGQYTGIACAACHEIWANLWCDDNEPCENCAAKGTTCQRPSCESGQLPKEECTKTGRCNRAHVGMDDNWTLAPWRKDLKRKGKQTEDREWPAKRRRVEEGKGNGTGAGAGKGDEGGEGGQGA